MVEQHGKTLVPQIRFAGFTDPWEQRKLGELSSEFKSGEFICADNVSESGSYPVYGGNGLRGYTTTFNHEGLYTLIGRQGALCGNVNIADGKSYFTEHAVAVKANHLNNTTFLYYLFGTLDLGQYSGQSAQPGLAVSNLVEVEAMVPDKAEQKKISRVFKTVDSLITLHQRKYDKLCVLKKSMLDKMFPKGGSLYPEIRFAGFTDPWEQRKLGELTESYSGGTPAAGESEFYGGSIPFIRSAEIAAESTELFLTEKGYESSSARMVKPGDVLYALYGATSGEVAVSRQKGAINQAILAILPRDDCDARYITAWLRKQKGYIVTTYLQGGQGNLSGVIVKNLEVFIPSLPEQQKIGFMLSHLDSLITLHQRKLELLRNIKKSMLDKMFV